MSELERYQQHEPAIVDSWVEVLKPVGDLAERISNTDFVPESLRGSTAAVAAAMLTGREMNIGPMQALRHIHIVKGKPGQSAELMRALVLREGHKIRYVETTDTRCIVEGRRRDDEQWTRVTFTADQARKASINLGGYPEDKLVARATSRLCRRIFADVVSGMPYTTDELEDVDDADAPAEPTTAQKRRTAQRKSPSKTSSSNGEKSSSVRAVGRQEAQAAEKATAPEPPLPGEEDGETVTADRTNGDDPVTASVDEPDGDNSEEMVTKAQLTKMAAVFGELDVKDRDQRVHYASVIVGRPLDTSKELTKTEAFTLIDTLEHVTSSDNPTGNLAALIQRVEDEETVDGELVDEDAQ